MFDTIVVVAAVVVVHHELRLRDCHCVFSFFAALIAVPGRRRALEGRRGRTAFVDGKLTGQRLTLVDFQRLNDE